jgi:succinate dehydrogenase / fumarate reductase cytochrome b subunit
MNQPLMLVPRSSLGSKYLMAVTGLGLTFFVIIHMLGNLQLFLGPDAVNSYAKALKSMPVFLWVARLGLLAFFVLHVVYGVRLWRANRLARPHPYACRSYREATLASRTMLVTGLAIAAFVLFHLAHFTFGVVERAPAVNPRTGERFTNYLDLRENPMDPNSRHDVYAMTVYGFRNPVVSLTYIVAMGFLSFHLSHGFGSLFQSLGLNHPRLATRLQQLSVAVAVFIFLGNCSMPVAVLLRLVGGNVPS